MNQEVMPFFDSSEAATKHAIQVSGKPPKDVALVLWPDKSIGRAGTDLNNALNENRGERLTADQHILVANYCQQYHWLYYVAHQCSHAQPQRVTPEARRAQQQEDFAKLAKQMKGLLAEMGSL